MSKFFYKNHSGDYLPVDFRCVLEDDLKNKLIIVTIENGKEQISSEEIEGCYHAFADLEVIKNVLENTSSSVAVLDSKIGIQLMSQEDLRTKKIVVTIDNKELLKNLPEISALVKSALSTDKSVIIVQTNLSYSDYLEVQEIKKRSDIRKARRGSGTTE